MLRPVGFRRADARREMGTFLISQQKGTDLLQVCPLLPAKRGNEECPHFSSGVRSSEATGLHICKIGCAGMHRGGPRLLPPRRAPFGRRAGQPSEGAPTRSACPRFTSERSTSALRLLGEEQDSNIAACDLPHPWGTCLACYRAG